MTATVEDTKFKRERVVLEANTRGCRVENPNPEADSVARVRDEVLAIQYEVRSGLREAPAVSQRYYLADTIALRNQRDVVRWIMSIYYASKDNHSAECGDNENNCRWTQNQVNPRESDRKRTFPATSFKESVCGIGQAL